MAVQADGENWDRPGELTTGRSYGGVSIFKDNLIVPLVL